MPADAPEHPIQLGLCVKIAVKVVHHRHDKFLVILSAGGIGGQAGGKLGIIAVLAPRPFAAAFFIEVKRQKYIIRSIHQVVDMRVQGRHRHAKFSSGKAFAVFEAVAPARAGDSLNAQFVKKTFPERQVFQQMQGGRHTDGKGFFVFIGAFNHVHPGAFL